MHNFESLDAALLNTIAAGDNTTLAIKSPEMIQLAATVTGKVLEDHHPLKFTRVIDYRLQALRKSGLIAYFRSPGSDQHGQWMLTGLKASAEVH